MVEDERPESSVDISDLPALERLNPGSFRRYVWWHQVSRPKARGVDHRLNDWRDVGLLRGARL